MTYRTLIFLAMMIGWLLPSSALADPRTPGDELERLRPTDEQVQAVFGLFLSQVPAILQDKDRQEVVSQLAPQALHLLNPEQRQALEKLASSQQLENIQGMTDRQRARLFFDAAQSLAHPSQQEWIQRMEQFTEEQR